MQPDDELCLCFHITKRKVTNFIRIEKPKVASQLSECGGAGTGCGWCRPYLERMLESSRDDDSAKDGSVDLPESNDYATQRSAYVKEGGGTPPPGATPID